MKVGMMTLQDMTLIMKKTLRVVSDKVVISISGLPVIVDKGHLYTHENRTMHEWQRADSVSKEAVECYQQSKMT